MDGIRSLDLLVRSRVAISQFERAKAGGIAAEIADARAALERRHDEVKRFVAAKKAMAKMLAARPASQGLVSASPRRGPVDAPQHGDDEERERESMARMDGRGGWRSLGPE